MFFEHVAIRFWGLAKVLESAFAELSNFFALILLSTFHVPLVFKHHIKVAMLNFGQFVLTQLAKQLLSEASLFKRCLLDVAAVEDGATSAVFIDSIDHVGLTEVSSAAVNFSLIEHLSELDVTNDENTKAYVFIRFLSVPSFFLVQIQTSAHVELRSFLDFSTTIQPIFIEDCTDGFT